MKKEENFSKCLFGIVLYLIIIQAIFLGIKQITFHFILRNFFQEVWLRWYRCSLE